MTTKNAVNLIREELESPSTLTAEQFARVLESVPPDAPPKPNRDCDCTFSDAWRCARDKNLPTIACRCECHRYIFRKAARP